MVDPHDSDPKELDPAFGFVAWALLAASWVAVIAVGYGVIAIFGPWVGGAILAGLVAWAFWP